VPNPNIGNAGGPEQMSVAEFIVRANEKRLGQGPQK
jgi:hypothetical protein